MICKDLFFIFFSDVSCVQVCSDSQESPESEARYDATLHIETSEDANKISRQTMAQEQHEDDVCHLPESQTPIDRRLGLWQWYASMVL